MERFLKHIVLSSSIFIVTSLLSGCGLNTVRSVSNSISDSLETITGTGDMKTTDFKVKDYDSVDVGGNFEIIYSNKKSDIVKIEIQENLIKHLEVDVKNHKLVINQKKNFIYNDDNRGKIYISTPELKDVTISGAASFDEADTIKANTFKINIAGAGKVSVPIKVKNLEVSTSGAGSTEFEGSADKATFKILGAGSIGAIGLVTKDADVTISGAGNCEIHCENNLNVKISGIGNLKYTGNPKVSQSITGLGSVKNVDGD